jgi:gamma-glutamyltranspeptidase/glutathione hydrolase
VALEWGVPAAVAEGLASLGHEITRQEPDESYAFGGAQLIHRLGDGYVAGSDHRKDGLAVGY